MVNAVHYLCGPLSPDSAGELLYQLGRSVERHRSLAERLYGGTTINEVGEMLTREIAPNYPIHRRRPFYNSPQVTLDEYWEQVKRFVNRRDAIVLTAIEGCCNHWTLFHRATDRTLFTYDSTRLERMSRRFCVISNDDSTPANYRLHPSRTYFLSLRE